MTIEERGVTKAVAKTCPCEACKKSRKEPSKIKADTIHGYSSKPSGGWRKQRTAEEQRAALSEIDPLVMGVELETTVKTAIDRYEIREQAARRFPHPAEPSRYDYPSGERDRYDGESAYGSAWTRYYAEEERLRELRTAEERRLTEARRASGYATAEEAVSMAAPIGFWHPKHDGSVSGPEFASLPASLAYWYGIRDDLATMFTTLLHAGVRSHAGDKAGMHISLSVESFVDSDHLIRFSNLVNHNANWSQKMSQRTADSLSWSAIGHDPFSGEAWEKNSLIRWANEIMQFGQSMRVDRYVAINAQCGDGRIEFRLPRGTLRLDRFYKNLEWVHSMVDYTRQFAPTDAASYMRWVMGQALYPDLKAWFTEKFRLPVTEPFLPTPAPEPTIATVKNSRGVLLPAEESSFTVQYCPCGDGCTFRNCGSCDDAGRIYLDNGSRDYESEENNSFYEEPEEQEEFTCDYPGCVLTHDMDVSRYTSAWVPRRQVHTHISGAMIGPARRYREDGTEYEYNAEGLPIMEAPSVPLITTAADPVDVVSVYPSTVRVARSSYWWDASEASFSVADNS